MKDDLVSKMIEELDKREVLCGFNHNNTRYVFRGFEMRKSTILVGRGGGGMREVDEGKFDIGVNIKR